MLMTMFQNIFGMNAFWTIWESFIRHGHLTVDIFHEIFLNVYYSVVRIALRQSIRKAFER